MQMMQLRASLQTSLASILLCGITGYPAIYAQQKLNLDFEHLSVEGTARPWGWSVYSYANGVSFSCDSSQTFSGNYSLQISSTEKDGENLFELSFFVEPSQILNRRLALKGWVRTSQFAGRAGIRISSVGRIDDEYGTLREDEHDINRSDTWTQLSTEISLDAQPHSVLVTIYYSGAGTMWFDKLSLAVDDEPVKDIPVAPHFTEAQLQQMARMTAPFSSVEPHDEATLEGADFGDLDAFRSIVGDSRIIALGEATHGTSEFFKIKHLLLHFAVAKLGVRVFVLEDNQLLAERINNYVLYGEGTAESVIRGLFAVWNTEEMLALIKWLRAYNAAHPDDMVEFAGIDVQNPALAIEHLDAFLSQRDTVLLKQFRILTSEIGQHWRSSYVMPDSTLMQWDRDALSNYNTIEKHKDQWLRDAENNTDSTGVQWAVKNARTIKQYTETILGGIYEGRDKAMAENIGWILQQRKPGTRIVVWAHDSHVSRGDATDAAANFFFGQSMGSYLSKQFGADYVAFGLFTYEGKCLGTISYSNFTQRPFDLYTSPEGTVDAGLHKISTEINSPYLIFNMKPFKTDFPEHEWINIQRPVRYVGYVAEDYGFGGRYRIPYQFDGIIFIDRSTASVKTH